MLFKAANTIENDVKSINAITAATWSVREKLQNFV